MAMQKAAVLDAWAMMAFWDGEPAAAEVESILVQAQQRRTPLLMSVVNVGELYYSIQRDSTVANAELAVEEMRGLGIQFVPIDWNLAQTAANFKVRGKISYVDCFAMAVAKQMNGELVTGDREFKPFEREVSIRWI